MDLFRVKEVVICYVYTEQRGNFVVSFRFRLHILVFAFDPLKCENLIIEMLRNER